MSEAVARFAEDFREVEARLPGARLPWLARARREALERFAQAGLPTTALEDWKYTSVAVLEKQAFPPAVAAPDAPLANVAPWLLPGGGHRLVFVDGRYAPALSQLPSSRAVVASLAQVLLERPEQAEPWLLEAAAGAFVELNSAFFADGAFVFLPRGVIVEEPIHLLYVCTGAGRAAHLRNLIVAEDDAQAVVIEHYVGLGEGAGFTNAVTRIAAGRDARVEHCKLQEEGDRAIHIAHLGCAQSKGSALTSHSVSLGAALARNDIATRFEGEHCETLLNGLYMAGGRQHVDHHTRIDHASPRGTSREFYRGILDGRGRGVFSGRVVVHKDAQHTDASQANHNLLLSREAEADTRPQLEIYADDVKCSHGATVGQLDENMLFYLRSRGMEAAFARNLLTYAFAREVLERIRLDTLRLRVEELLLARMPEGSRMRELV